MSLPADGQYSIPSPNYPEVAGEGIPRRHFSIGSEKIMDGKQLASGLQDFFSTGLKTSAAQPFLGVRSKTSGEYEWETYGSVATRITNFGAGVVSLGLSAKKPIGFFSVNRPEWLMAEHSSYVYKYV